MLMDEEIWKDIEGWEGYYQISSEGRVRSLDREVVYSNGRKHFYKGQILSNVINNYGYMVINLSKNRSNKQFFVHRLVAEAFLPNPDNLPCINHKDETPSHNNVDNLEFCDYVYNNNYGTRLQRISEKTRNDENRSKKVYQYTLDNQLVNVWESTRECGRKGFTQSHVAECCRGEYKQHKGFKWSYKPLEAHNNL